MKIADESLENMAQDCPCLLESEFPKPMVKKRRAGCVAPLFS
jgi:hypothetical protein